MKKVVCFRQGTFLLIYRKGRETMKTDNKKTIRGPEILESIGVGLWMIRTNKETGYSEIRRTISDSRVDATSVAVAWQHRW